MEKLQTVYVVTILLFAAVGGFGLGGVSAAGNAPDAGAGNAPFGQLVSDFVHDLQEQDEPNGSFGMQVATFVLANNPASDTIPDHAGPSDNREPGPPDHAQANDGSSGPTESTPADDPSINDIESDRGPPADRGNTESQIASDSQSEQANESAGETGPPTDRGDSGPPDDAGPPDDRDNDRSSDGGGPPDDVGPPDNAGPP